MDKPEHLIASYEMRSWYHQVYAPQAELEQHKDGKLPDIDRLCSPLPQAAYRGVKRRPGWAPAAMDEED